MLEGILMFLGKLRQFFFNRKIIFILLFLFLLSLQGLVVVCVFVLFAKNVLFVVCKYIYIYLIKRMRFSLKRMFLVGQFKGKGT